MKARISLSAFILIPVLLNIFTNSNIEENFKNSNSTIPEFGSIMAKGPFGRAADYDSGWVLIDPEETKTFQHNLGGNPDYYVVDLQARGPFGDVNQFFYGGESSKPNTNVFMEYYGVMWQALNQTSIQVTRNRDDLSSSWVRVHIWVVPSVDYDSGWKAIDPDSTLTLEHNLGGNTDYYLVDMQFKTSGLLGIHNRNYGLDTYYLKNGSEEYKELGANWHNLNSKSIKVYRGKDELYINLIRVRIWQISSADYDSGWSNINQGESKIFQHNLGGPWNDYYIDLQFKHNGAYAIHQLFYGGDQDYNAGFGFIHGAWIGSFDDSHISVSRGRDDSVVNQVRVRIWANPRPKYDSGWQPITKGETKTLNHNLGGDPDFYVIDLQFKDIFPEGIDGYGVNQNQYGSDDYQIYPGEDLEFHGGYWLGLTGSQIEVYRAGDEQHADQIRIRIWIPSEPSFDSGWRSISAGELGTDFVHDIGGDRDDYVIDMQFNDLNPTTGYGINQIGYGWNSYRLITNQIWSGIAWSNLETDRVHLTKGPHGVNADEVRVRIWKNPQPDYDSNWNQLQPGKTFVFTHNLGADADDYILDLQFHDEGMSGVNQNFYGGDTSYDPDGTKYNSGAFWYGLNKSTVTVQRQKDDLYVDNARVRIWMAGKLPSDFIYLPLVVTKH